MAGCTGLNRIDLVIWKFRLLANGHFDERQSVVTTYLDMLLLYCCCCIPLPPEPDEPMAGEGSEPCVRPLMDGMV